MVLFTKNRESDAMDQATARAPRKPGRPKSGNKVRKVTVMLPPDLHDWAMQQPEGLSGLIRRLLRDERAHATHLWP